MKTINFIRSSNISILNETKLDYISLFMPHLYGLENLKEIMTRFDLSKKTKKYFDFIKKISVIKTQIQIQIILKSFKKNNIEKATFEIIKLLWLLHRNFHYKAKFSRNNSIPISWCKIALYHFLPILKIINIKDINIPLCPIKNCHLISIRAISNNEINNWLLKCEFFWFNNNFKPKLKEIINHIKNEKL